jgi:hypothetical protein
MVSGEFSRNYFCRTHWLGIDILTESSHGCLTSYTLHTYSPILCLMLSLTRRSAFALRRFSTATPPAPSSHTAFPFLPVNALAAKPGRNKGITEIRGPYYHSYYRKEAA